MTEEKRDEGSVTLLNRGLRHFDLGADAKGKPLGRHSPGATHTYTAEQAKRLEGYKELVDIAKLPGQVDAKKLKEENAKLKDENARLREQLLAHAPKEEKGKPEKGKDK